MRQPSAASSFRWALAVALAFLPACSREPPAPAGEKINPHVERQADGSIPLFDGRVIPAMPKLLSVREQYNLRVEWLEKKHAALLPMMRKHGIGMWIIINEEFHHDPVTQYVAPTMNYVARRDIHIFVDADEQDLKRFSNLRRPNLEYVRFFEPVPVPRPVSGQSTSSTGPRPSG